MRPTRADDAGPRSERAAPRHRARDRRGTPPPRHARARGGPRDTGPRASHCRQTGPSGARHSRQAPAKPHGACHNRRHRLSPTVRVIAIGTGSHWGRLRRIGVGNLPAPIPGSLPQCPFPCPAATLQYPFPCPAAAFPSPKSSPRTWECANAGAGPVVGYRSRLWRRNSFYFRSDIVARTEKPPGPRAPDSGRRARQAGFHSATTIRASDSAGLSRAAAQLLSQNSSTAAPTGSLCNTKLRQKGMRAASRRTPSGPTSTDPLPNTKPHQNRPVSPRAARDASSSVRTAASRSTPMADKGTATNSCTKNAPRPQPLTGTAGLPVAVALGFEPRVAVTPHSISSAAPSAARTRYLTRPY